MNWDHLLKYEVNYDPQKIIDKYAFDIYEYSQRGYKNSERLSDFIKDMRELGKVRYNTYSLTFRDYGNECYKSIFKTDLGSTVILQSEKRGLYMNSYLILIK